MSASGPSGPLVYESTGNSKQYYVNYLSASARSSLQFFIWLKSKRVSEKLLFLLIKGR